MERLRAAIEQARKARTDGEGTPPPPGMPSEAQVAAPEASSEPPAEARPPEADLSDRWQALTPMVIRAGRLRRNRIVIEEKSPDRAPFDLLRTRLHSMMQKEGWRRIAITSPTMTCGKSTTCLNLAFALSRQPEVRTLVFEADMRRPALAKMLGQRGKTSFADVLEGSADFSEQALRIGDNVAVSMNYSSIRQPAELLHRRRTSALLNMLQETYEPDIMIFDMPPMMNSDDTLGFIKNVDCAVLVAMAEKTTLEEIDFCEKELAAHTNVAGVVLNRCRYGGGQYGYGYGYSNY